MKMRAKMSTGSKRHSDGARADTWNMTHAWNEAEAILSVSEPEPWKPASWRAECDYIMFPTEVDALAEALAAFVGGVTL